MCRRRLSTAIFLSLFFSFIFFPSLSLSKITLLKHSVPARCPRCVRKLGEFHPTWMLSLGCLNQKQKKNHFISLPMPASVVFDAALCIFFPHSLFLSQQKIQKKIIIVLRILRDFLPREKARTGAHTRGKKKIRWFQSFGKRKQW